MKSTALLPSNLPSVIDRFIASVKLDRSMTRGIFAYIILFTLFAYLVRTGRHGLLPIRIYRGNNAVFVSVDLIGKKNQVILE